MFRRHLLFLGLGFSLGFLVSDRFAVAAPQERSAEEKEAESLVAKALDAGMAGNESLRRQYLERALARAPQHAPARWHLGQVEQGGEWRTVDEVVAAAEGDPKIQEYRRLSRAAAPTPAAHAWLARWCRHKGLADEERFHWASVLQYDAGNEEAVRALDLKKYRNQWFTQQQIDLIKSLEKKFEAEREYWPPRLERWASAIEKKLSSRDDALASLRAIDKPAAIPWLEAYVSPRSSELAGEVVALVAQWESQDGTDSLVRHAVLSNFPAARALATEQLRKRPLHSFAGALVTSLTAPPELNVVSHYAPPRSTFLVGPPSLIDKPVGRSRHASSFDQRVTFCVERMGEVVILEDNLELVGPVRTEFSVRNRYSSSIARDVMPLARAAVAKRQTALVSQAVSSAQALEARNVRICEVLQTTTGQDYGRDQSKWWQWWNNYAEQYASGTKPTYRYESGMVHKCPHVYKQISCFSADTLVHTKFGKEAIADVRPGDYVLSQAVESGELSYRPVLATTVRPSDKTLKLTIGNSQIETTLGHPFWVVGAGWKMAKELKSGDQLHTPQGMANLLEVTEDEEAFAYNLVVADFNTYFVGPTGILVHDNTPHGTTEALVPGLTPSP